MKIFERECKTNFVDDNNVLVGFDSFQLCCEDFGFFLSRSIPSIPSKAGEDVAGGIDPDGFNFDTGFFRKIEPEDFNEYWSTLMAVFRLTKGSEQIFLILFNSQNGYYSHGFEMGFDGGETIIKGEV